MTQEDRKGKAMIFEIAEKAVVGIRVTMIIILFFVAIFYIDQQITDMTSTPPVRELNK